jgi:hypothetical protein
MTRRLDGLSYGGDSIASRRMRRVPRAPSRRVAISFSANIEMGKALIAEKDGRLGDVNVHLNEAVRLEKLSLEDEEEEEEDVPNLEEIASASGMAGKNTGSFKGYRVIMSKDMGWKKIYSTVNASDEASARRIIETYLSRGYVVDE